MAVFLGKKTRSGEVAAEIRELAARVKALRIEVYGPRGAAECARAIEVNVRAWYNYETGRIDIPARVMLRFMVLMNLDAAWLLKGDEAIGKSIGTGRPIVIRPGETVRIIGGA
jgi:hypothetical protein